MSYLYAAIAVVGVVAAGWGISASHRLASPKDILAALAALAGVVAFVIGILLAVLPDFFVT